ncbi:MAG: DnaJ domain-containing protein [Oligoflexia bacterium]|nr:DnaJ domain-containing protein [Oligoflexia bacterium]
MKDPYEILGVLKTANQNEIKKAYHKKAKKFHPDLNPGNKSAELTFKDISLAYEIIGNKEEREKYDSGKTVQQQQERQQEKQQEQENAFNWQNNSKNTFYNRTKENNDRFSYSFAEDFGENNSDFLENLFRSTMRSSYKNEQKDTSNTYFENDEFYQMEVDFKDAILGANREITFPNGKRLQIKIPPGVESGTKLRFKNQGSVRRSGPFTESKRSSVENEKRYRGDAYVEITVKPLKGFRRVGNTIETEVSISFIEALLGAEIKISTIDGFVMLKIPSGTDTGSRLRIRGKGVVLAKGRGDQIVLIKVVLPKIINTELQKSIRDWKGKYSYNPRED